MDLQPPTRTMLELCADSRTVPSLAGGLHLHTGDKRGLDADPHLGEANERPRMPQITALSYGPGALGSPLTARFLDRLPPESLDVLGHVPLPSEEAGLDPLALGARADELGLFVQLPTAELTPGRDLPGAANRLVPLDADGAITSLAGSATVRVVPSSGRSAGAYRTVSADVAAVWADRPYLSGRIVFGADGVELGWPAGLVDHWYGPALARFGRPLSAADVEASGAAVPVDGYVDVLHRIESSPPDSQALVVVTGPSGDDVFLTHRGRHGVAFLDPGTGSAAVFPTDPREVRYVPLPGTMSLGDRLGELTAAQFDAAGEPDWPIRWPAQVEQVRPADDGAGLVVVGPADAEPRPIIDRLVESGAAIDQPIIVLGADRSGAPPDPGRVAQLGSLLEQYGWRGKVPVVVTRAGLGPDEPGADALRGVLDGYGASLVHRAPARSGAGAAGGLTTFLGNPWTVREAAGDPAGEPVRPPIADDLAPELLGFAAGDRRLPAHGPPSTPVATFLTTPLTGHADSGGLDLTGDAVKTLRPMVAQIAGRDPSFAGHDAALQLAALGHADVVTSYLGDAAGRAETIFRPLLAAADHQQDLQTLLPHLATLAGGDVADQASRGILTALNDLLTGAAEPDTIHEQIWAYKDYLPKEGRVAWIRRLGPLKDQLPAEHRGDIDKLGEAILHCPE